MEIKTKNCLNCNTVMIYTEKQKHCALLFGALKALGWLFIGIAALKFTGVI